MSPEEIAQYHSDLELEQIYAAIAYYLHNKRLVDDYLARLAEYADEQVRAARARPSPAAERVAAFKRRHQQQQPVS